MPMSQENFNTNMSILWRKFLVTLLVLSSLLAVYLLVTLDPLHASAKITANKWDSTIDVTSEKPQVIDLGDVQFNTNTTDIILHFLNSSDSAVNLKMIGKSCSCINLADTISIQPRNKITQQITVGNYGRLSGKQRIRIDYACADQDKVITLQVDYNSVVPVLCRTATIYPVQRTAGTFDLEIESTSKTPLPRPTLDHRLVEIVDFRIVNDTSIPYRYRLTLRHQPLEPGSIHLDYVFRLPDNVNISVPLSIIVRELYIVTNKVQYEDKSNFKDATINISRWDGKSFRITEAKTGTDISVEYDTDSRKKHVLKAKPRNNWISDSDKFTLDISTDSNDMNRIKHHVFVYKPVRYNHSLERNDK